MVMTDNDERKNQNTVNAGIKMSNYGGIKVSSST
jgi:hypothetical protein